MKNRSEPEKITITQEQLKKLVEAFMPQFVLDYSVFVHRGLVNQVTKVMWKKLKEDTV